ncbi:hypothetical protein BGS_1228 [Beggiatoa sp. SS]|nr:hypothetical protein BGS_1228 [Beggiatoa sp. SS]
MYQIPVFGIPEDKQKVIFEAFSTKWMVRLAAATAETDWAYPFLRQLAECSEATFKSLVKPDQVALLRSIFL